MRGGRSRTACWLLVGILVVAQAATHAHVATTVHVRCAQHGELVDVEPTDGSALPPTGVSDPSRGNRTSDRHCLAAAAAHANAIVARVAPLTAAFLVGPPAAPRPPVARAPVRLTLLRFAPKTSPPVARPTIHS